MLVVKGILQRHKTTENQMLLENENNSNSVLEVCGFIGLSGPYDILSMRRRLQRIYGFSTDIFDHMFGSGDLRKLSPVHVVQSNKERININMVPNICILHGTKDKTASPL